MAVSWQFDRAEACGPRSLAYSPHAKPPLTHCLCQQIKSLQWSAPLASSTGATEARRILAVSWQFDHAEACGPRSLAYSPHAKPPLTHCLCQQIKSLQWSAPLASSTGATEARRILAVSWQFDHAEACGPRSLAYSPHAKPAPNHCLGRQVRSRQWSAPLASSTGTTEARIFSPHSKFDTFTFSCLACHVVSDSFDRSHYYLEMRSSRFLSCLRWEFRN